MNLAVISATDRHEYGVYVCQDNMLTHYYPSKIWKSKLEN